MIVVVLQIIDANLSKSPNVANTLGRQKAPLRFLPPVICDVVSTDVAMEPEPSP